MYPLLAVPCLGVVRATDACTYAGVALAVLLGAIWTARTEGLDAGRVRRAFALLAVAGLAGGRLHFLVNHAGMYAGQPWQAIRPWSTGFHVGGGLLALLLALPWVARRYALPPLRLADGGVVPVVLALAIARLGCFLQGCCHGTPCEHPWCLAFPKGSPAFVAQAADLRVPWDATTSLPVHPLQLYFLASYLAVAGIAVLVRRHRRVDGDVLWTSLLLISICSASLEGLRDDPWRAYWGPLPQLTWTALLLAGIAAVALLAGAAHARRRPRGDALSAGAADVRDPRPA